MDAPKKKRRMRGALEVGGLHAKPTVDVSFWGLSPRALVLVRRFQAHREWA
jgi:hypothetical protein